MAPPFRLLLGPGGEGKSTAVLQTLATLVDEDPRWKVLWRHDETCSLTVEHVRQLPEGRRWVIATDDADLIAKDLFIAVKTVQAAGRGDVAFLLTCCDTEWRAADGGVLPWSAHAVFHGEELNGLDKADARQIVRAWSLYGPEGLGELAGHGEDEAARRLLDAATREAELKEGAFFGAMLEVRIGGSVARAPEDPASSVGGA